MRSRHSSLMDRMNLSRFGLKFGERGGNRTAVTPLSSRMTRNVSENFVSRSISKYFFSRRNPSSASHAFLVTWSIHGSSGLAVLLACNSRIDSNAPGYDPWSAAACCRFNRAGKRKQACALQRQPLGAIANPLLQVTSKQLEVGLIAAKLNI